MRTTLDIDDDVLAAAKEPAAVFGFRPFPKVGVVVTNELINQIKDQEGL